MTVVGKTLSLRMILVVFGFILSMVANYLHTTQAQDDVPHHTWELYVENDINLDGLDRLLFVDVLTGNTITTDVYGERYTPALNGIIFYDYIANQVKLARTDGVVVDHPFMQIGRDVRQVDWIVSNDRRNIAWTMTYGSNDVISTRTFIATVEGANMREVWADGPRAGVRALPVAFSVDNDALIMDTQPDGLGRFTAYTQYAGLFSVDLTTAEVNTLPGEPACYCGAGIRAGHFLRLSLNQELTGFDVRVYDLQDGQDYTISALPLSNYTQAGDILISPDGTLAVYALSQIENFGTPQQSIETVFMLVDLLAMEQRPLTAPITDYVHPVRWSEENTAVIFTSPQRNGTWKADIATGEFIRIARITYVGVLSDL